MPLLPIARRRAIYLDGNAGVRPRPEVREALLSLLEENSLSVANPSSIHLHGREAKRLVAESREKIALSLGSRPSAGIDPEQLIFTSSGSEANQLAIGSILETPLSRGQRPHWITTPVEHDSVMQMIEWVESRGGTVSMLPLTCDGRPDVGALGALWEPQTALVSAVWAGNETGAVTDVAALAAATQERGVALHLDAAQAWGKLKLEIDSLAQSGSDTRKSPLLVSVSAHKIGGLAGTGVLYVSPGTRISPAIRGKQEKGRRGGTENLLGIVAAGAAAAGLDPDAWAARVRPLRDKLEGAIRDRISGTIVNAGDAPRVANTTNLCFEGVEGDGMVMALDLAGFSVSSGSACSSGAIEPSHVLMAMGRSRGLASGAIRVSLPDVLEWSVLERFVDTLAQTVARIRKSGSVQPDSDVRPASEIGAQSREALLEP